MGLDFTALNNIPLQVAKKDFTEPISYEASNLALKPEKTATGQNTAPSGQAVHSHRLDREKEERARLREMYSTYQENIRRSGGCRSDILKGMKRGEAPLALLLKALECISLMTGDPHYYNQAKNDLRDIYTSLEYEAPAEQELQEVQERLSKLTEALERETDSSSRERIYKAIQSHKKKEENLLKLIS